MFVKQKLLALAITIFALSLILTQSAQAGSPFVFNKNLQIGSVNIDVRELQRFLNNNGFVLNKIGVGSLGQETTFFGPSTRNALIKFQKTNKIIPAAGYFGLITRNAVNKIMRLLVINPTSPTSPTNPGPSENSTNGNQPANQINTSTNQNSKNGYYTISGSITGIVGAVILQNNGKDDFVIDINQDSNFTFPVAVVDGASYNVTVKSKYSDQTCYVHNNAGVVSGTDIKNIKIACGANLVYNPFTFIPGGSKPASYSLTYSAGTGGTISGIVSQTINSGGSGSAVTAVSNTGYSFASWSDGVLTAERTDSSVTGNKSVSATFAINTYTVTFNTNGGNGGSTATQTLSYNTPTALTANGFTKTGYTFAGWATTTNGAVVYADGASYTIGAGNVSLFAKWVAVAPSALSYNSSNLFTVNTAISTLSPTVSGSVDSYSVSPSLPAGLSFNTTNGQITGTPTASTAQSTYTITATNTGGSTTFDIVIMVYGTVVGANGKIWLDRNLGAKQVATSSTDYLAYGDLFQWGRAADGHQVRTSSATSTNSTGDDPGNDNFILEPNSPYDWRSSQNDNLWQGAGSANNPCPTGFRLPTEAEWTAERLSWSFNNSLGAYSSPLKLTSAGYRLHNTGDLSNVGLYGAYWSSVVTSSQSRTLIYTEIASNMSTNYRSYGMSVRCTANSYSVSYNDNGSTSGTVPASQTKTHDVTLVLATNSGTLVKTGYTFFGWNTAADGTGTNYTAGANYLANVSVTLYAKWIPALAIGDSYQGGKIAYIFQSGDTGYVTGEIHGLIASNANLSTGIIWAKPAFEAASVPSGTLPAIGDGSANTDKIIAQNGSDSSYAAGLARACTDGGYNDWYLPSRDELTTLFDNRVILGGFEVAYYWSSYENNATTAWSKHFTAASWSSQLKNTPWTYVRAVRSF